jgi:superfamily II DNA helicase RecQ
VHVVAAFLAYVCTDAIVCRAVTRVQALGYDDFKPHQQEVLAALLKNSTSVIWRGKTAAGKSLPWMLLPFVVRELGEQRHGPVLVVLPLKLIAASHIGAVAKINSALARLGKEPLVAFDCTTCSAADVKLGVLQRADIVLFIPENLESGPC